MIPAYIMHEGRIWPVVGMAKMNGIPSVVVRDEHSVRTIPLALAVEAPSRTRPRLATINGERI